MLNISWLTTEAQNLHQYFVTAFYALVTAFILLGVVMEYFKMPLGQLPAPGILVGRALIAILLLVSYNEVANTLASIADTVASDLGNLNNFDSVLKKMADKVDNYSIDWLNARSLIVTALSILTYTFLFYSVIIAEVAHIFTWTLLYAFAPLLIALFVLPATAGATKALYRSLIEVTFWKILWAALSALLWASVLADMNSGDTLDFMKVICINLILGGSLLATPWIVHTLGSAGLAGFTRDFSGISSAVGHLTPSRTAQESRRYAGRVQDAYRGGQQLVQRSASLGTQAALFAKNPLRNSREVGESFKTATVSKMEQARWVMTGRGNVGGARTQQPDQPAATSWQRFRSLSKKGVTVEANNSRQKAPPHHSASYKDHV